MSVLPKDRSFFDLDRIIPKLCHTHQVRSERGFGAGERKRCFIMYSGNWEVQWNVFIFTPIHLGGQRRNFQDCSIGPPMASKEAATNKWSRDIDTWSAVQHYCKLKLCANQVVFSLSHTTLSRSPNSSPDTKFTRCLFYLVIYFKFSYKLSYN